MRAQLGKQRKSGSEHAVAAGFADAEKALKARKGKPDESDAPPPSTFPGATPKPIPDQLKLL